MIGGQADRNGMEPEDHNFAGLLSEAHDLPPFAGEIRSYVLCSTPRTGSTLISDALARSGRFGVPAEYLHPDAVNVLGRRFDAFSSDGSTLDANRFLASLVRCRTSPDGWFGMKCHFDQLVPFLPTSTCRALLARSAFVRVARRNRLAQAISFEVARQTDLWHVRAAPSGAADVVFDHQRIDVALRMISAQEAQWDLFFEANSIRPLLLHYEDVLETPLSVADALGSFLKGPPDSAIDLQATDLQRLGSAVKREWRDRYLASLRFGNGTSRRSHGRPTEAVGRPPGTAQG